MWWRKLLPSWRPGSNQKETRTGQGAAVLLKTNHSDLTLFTGPQLFKFLPQSRVLRISNKSFSIRNDRGQTHPNYSTTLFSRKKRYFLYRSKVSTEATRRKKYPSSSASTDVSKSKAYDMTAVRCNYRHIQSNTVPLEVHSNVHLQVCSPNFSPP